MSAIRFSRSFIGFAFTGTTNSYVSADRYHTAKHKGITGSWRTI